MNILRLTYQNSMFYLNGLQRLGISGKDSVVVEDSVIGLQVDMVLL